MTLDPGSRRPLPHLAYLEALGACEENAPRWHAVTGGYAALQLFDLWVEHGCGAVAPSVLEVRRVRKRIERIAPGDPIGRCLTHLVDVLERAHPPRGSDEDRLRGYEVGRILAAYGKLLQYESSWSLSRDVHATLIEYARTADDEERLLDSMLMVAFCHRMLGQLDEARDAYGVLREAAREARSEQYLLLSELGFSKLAVARGNLPAAAGMLDRILEETQVGEHGTVRAKALLDRARLATQLGDHTTAAILGHQALECTTDPLDRDRILLNIGLTLTNMGLWNEARDAYLVAGATAQELTVRWMAQINLMELAYLERNEILFEQYHRAVAGIELPPYVDTVYHETRAHGLCVFGRVSEATDAFRRMLDVASRHGLNEFVLKAERALGDVERVTPPFVRSEPEGVQRPTEIFAVADALSRLRAHAGL
ncbi:MAG TPA: tetratricopeptide repeat protein [Gemmatimonadaceae bacterium]|nr:tetratricopeptide repeat protein [Gemmatimonadaceae bacterium]